MPDGPAQQIPPNVEAEPQPPRVPGFVCHERVGRGGFAEVWRAVSDAGRAVVLKVAHDRSALVEGSFRTEESAIRRLGDAAPDLVGDGETSDGRRFLALEFLGGGSLADRIRALPDGLERVQRFGTQLLDAVQRLHAVGIVHGDLKPDNVLFGDDDQAVVIDFGTATGEGIPVAATDIETLPGTPTYMAPEQCTPGARVDARTDVYALGVILYEMLAGTAPFTGTPDEVREQHRTARAAPLHSVHAPIADVLTQCLAKAPGRRFASVSALRSALEAAFVQPTRADPSPAQPSVPTKTRAREDVVAIWVPTRQAAERLGGLATQWKGAVAHVEGERAVLVFGSECGAPVHAAARCAAELLERGWATHVRIDRCEARVRVRRGNRRYLSARFAASESYPAPGDAPGVWISDGAMASGFGLSVETVRPGWGILDAEAVDGTDIARRGVEAFGREGVLSELGSIALGARRAGPSIATIVGPRGIGKTTVAQALVDRLASSHEQCVVSIRAGVGSHASRWPAAAELLSAVKVQYGSLGDDDAALDIILDPHRPDDAATEALRAAPGALRHRLAEAVSRVLGWAARRHAVAVILDDAHKADEVLLDAIERATLSERGAALNCFVFADPSLLSVRQAWGHGARRRRTIELGPLDEAAASAMIRARLAPARNVPGAVVERLRRRTGGAPNIIVEVTDGLRRGGFIRPIPGGRGHFLVTDAVDVEPKRPLGDWLVEREFERLSPELRALAGVFAVAGPELLPGEFEAIISTLEREGAPVVAIDPEQGITQLREADVLVRRRSGRFAFRHPTMARLAASTLATVPESVHRVAFTVLSAAGDLDRAPHHAARCGRADWAARVYLDQAESAWAAQRYLEAELCASRGLEQLTEGDPRRSDVLRLRGLARFHLGRYHDAHHDLQAAAVAYANDGLRLKQAHALLDDATVLDWSDAFDDADRQVKAAQGMVDSLDDPLLVARLQLGLGRSLFRRNAFPEACTALEDAAARGARLGLEGYETHVIGLLLAGSIRGMLGESDAARETFDALMQLCEAHGDRMHLAAALQNRCVIWFVSGDLAALRRDLEQSVCIARDSGLPVLEARSLYNAAEVAYLDGDLDEARSLAERSFDLHAELGGDARSGALSSMLLAARIGVYRGNLAETRELLLRIEPLATSLSASDALLLGLVRDIAADAGAAVFAQRLEETVQGQPQEQIEMYELAGLAARRRGEEDRGLQWLRHAAALAEEVPNLLRGRVRAHLVDADHAA